MTPLELTSAYSVFPNMGMRIAPVLVKKVVDRFGRVLEDNTMEPLDILVASTAGGPVRSREFKYSQGQERIGDSVDEVRPSGTGLVDETQNLSAEDQAGMGIEYLLARVVPGSAPGGRPPMRRVLAPATSYLMLSVLRDTCMSGTASSVSRMRRRDLGGKTGTTDECTDAWFVGFNPKYTTGVWIGHDAKVSLGGREYGAASALPVWMDFMAHALQNEPIGGYPPPPGVVFPAEIASVRNPRWEALLEAKPDFEPSVETKEISPVDVPFATAAAASPSIMGFPMGAFGFFPHSEGLRVLSPTGQPLGQGDYVADQRGTVRLHRNDYIENEESKEGKRRREPSQDSMVHPRTMLQGLLQRFLRDFGTEQ